MKLTDLKDMTPQQVFDHVAAHLRKQGVKSTLPIKGCAYRGEDGLMCAAGCLMSDEEYKLGFEGQPWRRLVRDGQVPKEHEYLISQLQWAHDSTMGTLETRLADVAHTFNLVQGR